MSIQHKPPRQNVHRARAPSSRQLSASARKAVFAKRAGDNAKTNAALRHLGRASAKVSPGAAVAAHLTQAKY